VSIRLVRIIALSAAAGLIACARDNRLPVSPPALDVTAGGVVSGNVLGPSGSICNSLPAGTRLQVNVINIVTGQAAGQQVRSCPDNTYTFSLPPSTYLLRVTLPTSTLTASGFPWRTITVPPVEVTDGAVARDLPVTPGIPLGGGVTIDGQPLEGVALNLTYAQAPIFGVAATTSGPDGAWAEFFGRSPALLQSGIRVQPSIQCDALGALLVTPPRTAAFLFPDEASGISCGFTEAPAVQFSHTRTRLVVTPGPGDIGNTGVDLSDQFGLGWGVQFPVNPGERPRHGSITLSQLFLGGLIVGIRPDRVLTGVDINGEAQCAPVCRDFGLDGRVQYNTSPQFGTKVTWRYSDATSSEGVGLKVVQKSYDGVPPADYVLFRFTLTNSAAAPLTFYAGMFADWDIDDDYLDDVGATDLNGRLMYMTNASGGIAAGSLILSDAPVSGNAFFSAFDTPTATLVAAMAGDFSTPSVDTPDDYRYVHAVGPITLAPGAAQDVWIAIVAGDDPSQLLTNAAAAGADVANRRSGGNTEAMAPEGATPEQVILNRGAPATRSTAICKRGCAPARLQ